MVKTIVKETGIVILLVIAIILILAIVFYDYVPNNKTIPIKPQAYEFSDDIKAELEENIDEGQNIIKTYYIDEIELDNYESTSDYNKGKPNPFADTSTITNTAKNTTANNVNSTNTVGNTENKEVYYNKPGKY